MPWHGPPTSHSEGRRGEGGGARCVPLVGDIDYSQRKRGVVACAGLQQVWGLYMAIAIIGRRKIYTKASIRVKRLYGLRTTDSLEQHGFNRLLHEKPGFNGDITVRRNGQAAVGNHHRIRLTSQPNAAIPPVKIPRSQAFPSPRFSDASHAGLATTTRRQAVPDKSLRASSAFKNLA